jgi:methylthioribose-1-phosphate isomerase
MHFKKGGTMKSLRGILSVLLLIGLIVSLQTVSFAKQKDHKAREEAFVKLLNDSSVSLKASRPDLAADLTKLADEEAKELQEGKEGMKHKKELEGKAEKEMEGRREANLKLLRDSAAALQTSHPDLAADLTKTADRKAKRMAEKKEGKEDTKEAEGKE